MRDQDLIHTEERSTQEITKDEIKIIRNMNGCDDRLKAACDNLCNEIDREGFDERIADTFIFFIRSFPFHPNSENKKKKPDTSSIRLVGVNDYIKRLNDPVQKDLKAAIENTYTRSRVTLFKIDDISYGKQAFIHAINVIGIKPNFAISLTEFFNASLLLFDQTNPNSTPVV